MKNIAIVTGGNSSEYSISIESAKNIKKHFDTNIYNIYTIIIKDISWILELSKNEKNEINKNDFSAIINNTKITFDFAFIMIHGTPGEDGRLQAYFDLLNIPYSSCDFFVSALTFNKFACKNYLGNYGILTANSVIIRKDFILSNQEIINSTGLPCFVKPNGSGSSYGISKVNEIKELNEAIDKAFSEGHEIIIEEFIEGKEITCGLFKTADNEYIFPLTEIVTKNEFFDYEAKYTGKSDEITPARISNLLTEKCKEISSQIYNILNCKGIVRIDYILNKDDFYFLEINTVPGMTQESLVPQQIEASEHSIKEIIDTIISKLSKNLNQ